ncbi:hypothetical protein O988_02075 [Pseudogymnoascus sp. VKM F-3808]|nr:hypothetical protein O988_02075 [Pseudogymnoascus sp. VKM F-3808]
MYHFGSMAQLPETGNPITMPKLVKMEVLQHDSLLATPRRRAFRGIRRVRPALDLHRDVQGRPEPSATAILTETKRSRVDTLLRLWIKSPWEDYQAIKPSAGLMVAGRKDSYFKMATVTSFPYVGAVNAVKCFSGIRHPNVAPVHDLYHCDNMLHIVGEYLELSMAELEFQYFQLEEWEVTTIMTKVRGNQRVPHLLNILGTRRSFVPLIKRSRLQ